MSATAVHMNGFMGINCIRYYGFLPQRLAAALAAIWERFLGVSDAALAAPPFSPPSRPRATAAGFLALTTGGSVLETSPMDSRKTRCANSLGSRGRVFERSGIRHHYPNSGRNVNGRKFQTDPLPKFRNGRYVDRPME